MSAIRPTRRPWRALGLVALVAGGLLAAAAPAGAVEQPYFNLNVCYEGTVGQTATGGRFGWLSNFDAAPADFDVNKFVPPTDGSAVPLPLPTTSFVGDGVRRYSDEYVLAALQPGNLVWTVGIDGTTKTSTMNTAAVVTENNRCPDDEVVPSVPVPSVLAVGSLALVGGWLVLRLRRAPAAA